MWTAIIMPDDVALEKVNALRCLGATVERVRPASIVDTKHVRPPLGRLRPGARPRRCRAEFRTLFGFSTWYDIYPKTLGADGADLHNHAQQNIARQYAANFGKNDTKDPPSHHLVQNTESVLVTTTAPPRGDGADHSGNAKLEVEPRGFFADQFEVGFFLPQFVFFPLMLRPHDLVGFLLACFTSYDLEHAHDPVASIVPSDQKG